MKEDMTQLLQKNRHLLCFDSFKDSFKHHIDEFLRYSHRKEAAEEMHQYMRQATEGNLKARNSLKKLLAAEFLNGFALYENGTDAPVIKNLSANENNETADYILPFDDMKSLSAEDKFEILLYRRRKINDLGYDEAFRAFCADTGYKSRYTAEDIDTMYAVEVRELSFMEKTDIVIQKLYAELYGLKQIDTLAYSDVNEVGISNSGGYVYCWLNQKIHLDFLTLTEENVAVIQNRSISFDEKAGQLCTTNPEVLCYRADNARITNVQPPYASARNICIRIFNKRKSEFSGIIKDDAQRLLIKTIIKSGQKISLQGSLGVGKTTTMQTLLELLDDDIHIGSAEDYFEQHNRIKYEDKRIVELQTVHGKDISDAVMTLLRLSVDAANVGEARDGDALFAFIQLAQAIPNTAMFTTHVASPEDSVPRFKNMLMQSGNYYSEYAAAADIVNYINVIFQHNIIDGERRITDIVEIVPFVPKSPNFDISISQDKETLEKLALIQQIQQNISYMYRLNPLMVFENGCYKLKNKPSRSMIEKARQMGAGSLMNELLAAIGATDGEAGECLCG